MQTKQSARLIGHLIAPLVLCAASVASGETAPVAGTTNTDPLVAKDHGKPLFEVWDEEIAGRCSLGVAMDGSVLLFKDTQEPDFVWVKRSEDGGKSWGGMIKVGKRVEIKEDMTDDGRYKNNKDAGETWIDEHEDDELFDGPPDLYGCKAALLKLTVDGRDVLLFSSPGNKETRTDITVWVSFDGGRSWPRKRLVREGAGNYTWMAAGREGTPSEGMIYLVAGKDWMARFNMAWVLEGAEASRTPAAPAAKPSEE